MSKRQRNKSGDVNRASVTQALVSHITSLRQLVFEIASKVVVENHTWG